VHDHRGCEGRAAATAGDVGHPRVRFTWRGRWGPEGPNALTRRAVTIEAGCAKGVLHRHFTDSNGFLLELILDRLGRLDASAPAT
jgi:hypothetical protein